MKRLITFLFFFLILSASFAFSQTKNQPPVNYDKKEMLFGYAGEVLSIAFNPDGKIMVIGTSEKKLITWDVATWKIINMVEENDDRVTALAFTSDGKILASGDRRDRVYLWNTSTWKTTAKIKAYGSVEALSFNQDGSILAIACSKEKAMLWDVKKNRLYKDLNGHKGDVRAIAFSPDGTKVATGSRDNSVIIWDANTGEKVIVLTGHTSTVEKVAFSPDGKYLTSGGADNIVMVWDMKTGSAINRLAGHSDRICSLSYLPNTNILASGDCRIFLGPFFRPSYVAGSGCKVILWDVEAGKQLKTIDADCSLSCMVFSSDAKYFAVGNAAGSGQFITVYERK
jgi:WD40 repeat protein